MCHITFGVKRINRYFFIHADIYQCLCHSYAPSFHLIYTLSHNKDKFNTSSLQKYL